jgi:hypothetical protein
MPAFFRLIACIDADARDTRAKASRLKIVQPAAVFPILLTDHTDTPAPGNIQG